MERYSLGVNINGYKNIDIDSDELETEEIKNSLIVILLDERSNGRLFKYYTVIKQWIIDRNRIILLMNGDKSKIRKQIAMLLFGYRVYDIYEIEDISTVTYDYIEKLYLRKPSENEVKMFIGEDIVAYDKMSEILVDITDAIKNKDVERMKYIVEENMGEIESFASILDYNKNIIDRYNSGDATKELDSLKKKLNKLKEDKAADKELLDKLKEDNRTISDDRDTYRSELIETKQKLEETLNASSMNKDTVIKMYREVQTSTIKCKAKVIVYFKEISRAPFIYSLINNYVEYLKSVKKLRVKLMIYDENNGFIGVYKPLPIIGSPEFVRSKNLIVNTYEKLVVVEANRAIIEDTLKADWDIVMVYDKMRDSKDIVVGNNVYKYYILNSLSEFNSIDSIQNINKSRLITRKGVLPEALAIEEVDGYKTKTKSGKLAAYIGMRNCGEDNRKIFEIIDESTHINSLSKKPS